MKTGCEILRCKDWEDGVCKYPMDFCKYSSPAKEDFIKIIEEQEATIRKLRRRIKYMRGL